MAQAQQGDTVKVHYTGKLADDSVFDSSEGRDPLTFTIGSGEVIAGFESAIIGMQPGETKRTTVSSDQAYGARRPDLLLTVERNEFPEDIEPEVGQQLQIVQPDGSAFIVSVTDVADGMVTLDANHPLAGQDLTFDLELVEIV